MASVEHSIFEVFRNGIESTNDNVKNIIDVKNNIFYLFDQCTSQIFVANSTSLTGLLDFTGRYQVYKPTKPVIGTAFAMRVSENNTQAAMLTDVGLFVMNFPHIWTCLMLPPNTHTASKPAELWMVVPEVVKMPQLFLYEVLQARWHPHRHHHLLALYNDNFLRLLDAKKQTLLRALSLGRHPSGSVSTLLPLRENIVDFDFVPPTKESTEFSLLLLKGTGDVSSALITEAEERIDDPMAFHMESKCLSKTALSSACSILVLASSPPVVIITTTSGIISHNTLLPQGSFQFLHTFEEYSFPNDDTKHEQKNYVLVKDQATVYRYFVLHAEGVHAVMIPLIPVLDHLKEKLDASMRQTIREAVSIVKLLVSTSVSDVASPVYGVGVIPLRATLSKLLVLPASGDAIVHEIDEIFPPVTDFLHKAVPTSSIKDNGKDFSAVISKYLLGSQSSKPPVLKVGEALKNATPKETLQILRTCVNNLKDDHFMKHEVVAELIDAKIQDNQIELIYQQKQMELIKLMRESLQQNAERIAERYEEALENHMAFQKRLENVAMKITSPGISVAEKNMKTELAALKQKADKLSTALAQTQAVYENIKKQEPKELNNPMSNPKANQPKVYLNEQRQKVVRENLQAMSESIKELKLRITTLNLGLQRNLVKQL